MKFREIAHDSAYVIDHAYRTSLTLSMGLAAFTAVAAPSETTIEEHSTLSVIPCETVAIPEGETMGDTIADFTVQYPAVDNALETFRDFSIRQGVGPHAPLAETALSVCFSADKHHIQDIIVLSVTPPGSQPHA